MEEQKKNDEYRQAQLVAQKEYREAMLQQKVQEYEQKQARTVAEQQMLEQLPMLLQNSKITGKAPTRQEFAGDYGAFLSQLPGSKPDDLNKGLDAYADLFGKMDESGRKGYNGITSLRDLTPEVVYAITANGGKLPENEEEMPPWLSKAFGPEYNSRRQEFSNVRTRESFKNLGESTEYPGMTVWEDPKSGEQFLKKSLGDTYDAELKELSVEEVARLSTFDTLKESVADIRAQFNPENVGFFIGRLKNLGAKFKNDPEYVSFRREVAQNIRVAYALSGKQISKGEMDTLLEGFIPDPNAPPENFIAQLDQYEKFLDRERSAFEKNLRKGRRNLGKPSKKEEAPKETAVKPEPRRIRVKVN
jgi:hypothetical protein